MGSMDRESKRIEAKWPAGNSGESDAINLARYAWCSVHFPTTGFVAGTLTYEVFNEQTRSFVAAVDDTGSPVSPVSVVAGQVVPVPLAVNHAKTIRLNMSAAQPDDLEFSLIAKT